MGPTRRAVLAGGLLVASVAVGVEGLMTVARFRSLTAPLAAPAPNAVAGPPLAGVELHPAHNSNMQCFVPVPQTGEWFTTQAKPGTNELVDPAGSARWATSSFRGWRRTARCSTS